LAEPITKRITRGWNAFIGREDASEFVLVRGEVVSSSRPDRRRLSYGNERSTISSLYTRLAIDVSKIVMEHVRVDNDKRYLETINSGLNDCLTYSANLDQTGKEFLRDAALTLFDEGAIAIVPVDTTFDPTNSGAYDVLSLRVGRIKEWFASQVRVDLYNERTGRHQEILIPKTSVAIVENPWYSVMNEPNSTLKRLIRKLNLLDRFDESTVPNKLDLIIQLPYLLKNETRKKQAKERRDDIQEQLKDSEYGIAYTDATEKVIQLNRPAENNLIEQIKYLTSTLYSQLGITESIMDGTADEATMINYYKRTIQPIVDALADSMAKTFISKTARTQGQRIMCFSNPFELMPMSTLGDVVDKFTRNEVASSNEMRSVIGLKPSKDPSADELRNKNLNPASPTEPEQSKGGIDVDAEG
jgi:hypothetical protein